MAPICGRCGKDIDIATLLKLQPTAQFWHRHGEVTHSDIGLCDAHQRLFQVALVHRGHLVDDETPAWEVGYRFVRNKEMTVHIGLGHLIPISNKSKTASLHQGGIGLI